MANIVKTVFIIGLSAITLLNPIKTSAQSDLASAEINVKISTSKQSQPKLAVPFHHISNRNLVNGNRIKVETEAGFYVDALIYQTENIYEGVISAYAKQDTNDGTNTVIATKGKVNSYITILSPNAAYSLKVDGARSKLIRQNTLPSITSNDEIWLKTEKERFDYKSDKLRHFFSKSANSDSMTELGLMIIHTPETDVVYENDVATNLSHLVAVTNFIFLESEAKIQIKLEGIEVVSYEDPFDFDITIDEMRNESNQAFEDLNIKRFELGADLVMYANDYIHGTSQECGSATVPGINGSLIHSKEFMFSALAVGCQEYLMAHEIGHNLGLNHSRVQFGDGTIFPYALGYGVVDNFVTVMAYSSAFNNADKIYLFSNPSLNCNNLPCGVSKDSADGADAVYSMNQVKETVASFYGSEPSLEVIKDTIANNNISYDIASCIYQNGVNTYLDYSGNVKAIKCDSLLIDSLEGLEYFPQLNRLTVQLSNVTNIDGLYGLDNIFDLNLAINNINSINSIASLKYLRNLNLSANEITDISALSELTFLSTLNLSSNPTVNLDGLKTISSLNSLHLTNNSINDLHYIESMKSLRILSLSSNEIVNLEHLRNLDSLIRLELSNNRLTDISALFDLTNKSLEYLFVAGNDEIFCWQLDYLSAFISELEVNRTEECDISDDFNDFDLDGLSNREELNQNRNPVKKNQFETPSADSSGGGSFCRVLVLAIILLKIPLRFHRLKISQNSETENHVVVN